MYAIRSYYVLMTVTNIIYTKLNMSTTATADQPGGSMMKWMMYLMPVFFMFMFNDYASGLSYYVITSYSIHYTKLYENSFPNLYILYGW